MATIRAYTTIEQSRKLAEILPLESADMTYDAITEGMREKMIIKDWQASIGLDIAIRENLFSYRNGYVFPCWSLAALLGVVSEEASLNSFKDGNWNAMVQQNGKMIYSDADNPVDACYELILKLNELNLL